MTDISITVDLLLGARAPSVSCAEAEEIGRGYFGIDARATALSSERDGNFRMRTTEGLDYLLKITNPAENASVTNLQTMALRHLEIHAPQLPIPRLVASGAGPDEVPLTLADGRRHVVRLMTFLRGRPLSASGYLAVCRPLVAKVLAELDLGLRDFNHAAAGHDLLWDVTRATRVRPMLDSVANADRRQSRGPASRRIRNIRCALLNGLAIADHSQRLQSRQYPGFG